MSTMTGSSNGTAEVLAIARRYVESGLSILPVKLNGTKKPIGTWDWLQERRPTPDELPRMFGRLAGIATVCGKVSGNLEVLDVDDGSLIEPFEGAVAAECPGLIERLCTDQTPRDGGGCQYKYRCLELVIPGNQKLAHTEPEALFEDGEPVIDPNTEQQKKEPRTLIETRGEGGYAIAPGSPPSVHKTGRLYLHLRGPELTALPEITATERDVLFRVARSFNRYVADHAPQKGEQPARKRDGLAPGDDFNARATWQEILEPHGWKQCGRRGDLIQWTRPGKRAADGNSATTGVQSKSGNDLFCCFSTNAHPFEGANGGRPCTSYSKFAAFSLLNHGGDFSAAAKALAEQGYGDKPTPQIERARGDHLGDRGLTKIDTSCKDLVALNAKAWFAIQSSNDPPQLFRYGGLASRIEAGDAGEPIIRALDLDRMRHHLARMAQWIEWKKRDGEFKERLCAPPRDIVRDVLATPDMPLPKMSRITEAPVFGADGTLQVEPGYHAGSQTVYVPAAGFTVPQVPEQPTQSDIERARELICFELFGDFPFVRAAELAHAVALALLPFARDLIRGPTPLHLIEKPSPGTGATLFVDVALSPALGRPIATMTEGRDEDEWRKRLTAKLSTGPVVILLDNLRKKLEAAAVASAITSPTWEDRMLKASEMIRMPVRCVWIATGNNPSLSSELTRRSIRIRIDAKQDRPWLRTGFRHSELRRWADAHRGELTWAALTLIRAWLVSGRPEGPRTIGMFEDWARTMGGILATAGIPGFLENLTEFYDASDADDAMWRAFVAAWWDRFKDKEVKVAEVFGLLGDNITLPLGDKGDQSQKIRLGKMLTENRDRTFAFKIDDDTTQSVRLVRGELHNRAYLWNLTAMSVSKTNTQSMKPTIG